MLLPRTRRGSMRTEANPRLLLAINWMFLHRTDEGHDGSDRDPNNDKGHDQGQDLRRPRPRRAVTKTTPRSCTLTILTCKYVSRRLRSCIQSYVAGQSGGSGQRLRETTIRATTIKKSNAECNNNNKDYD